MKAVKEENRKREEMGYFLWVEKFKNIYVDLGYER